MWVFISYAAEDRDVAEQTHLALTGAGHHTFFDKESLPPGGDFHSRIRAAVQKSDLFLFLISPDSVRPGSYALTELKYAKAKWRHPLGHVLPVVVRPVEWGSIPNYLKAVTVLEPEGNTAAEVLVALSDLLSTSGGSKSSPTAPDESVSSKPAVTRLTAWIIILVVFLAGAIWAVIAKFQPVSPDVESPPTTVETALPKGSEKDQESRKPAPIAVQETDALMGLSCRVPSLGQNPIISRVEEIAPPEYTVDLQRHLLLGKDGQPVSVVPATNWGSLKSLRFIVVHFTAGSARSVEAIFQRPKEEISGSAHVLIARNGTVSQLVPFDYASRHAGSSHWKDVTGLNPYSVGIELENWGRLERKNDDWIAFGTRRFPEAEVLRDPRNGTVGWQKYTTAQLRAFFSVACAFRRAYPLIEDVVGHDQIAPARKIDPGPAFPMEEMRRRLFIDARSEEDS